MSNSIARNCANDMAEAILNEVNVSSMFNLQGVVAVVTGGGSVSDAQDDVFLLNLRSRGIAGYRSDD